MMQQPLSHTNSAGRLCRRKGIVRFAVSFFFISSLLSPAVAAEQKPAFQFSKNQEIQQVKPKKPVKVKLHRTAKGEYSWDLTGDDVDEIVKADRRLRKQLTIQ